MSNAPEALSPVNEQATTRQRVGTIAAWLVDGKLRPECVAAAMQEWRVSRRTAQAYVARAAAKMVRATTFEDPLFALKLSQIQRDKLHQELQELLRKGEFLPLSHWKMKLQTIQADLKLLDSRDRTAAKLLQANCPPPLRGRAGLEAQIVRPESPSPLVGEGRGGGADTRDQPAIGAPEANPREVLREEVPQPRAAEKPKPQPTPRRNPLVPTLVDAARVALAKACAQTTVDIAIVPTQPNSKPDKGMRPPLEVSPGPAPGGVSCALESAQVVNPARSPGAARDPKASPGRVTRPT